jgi:hypothetical protein
MTPSSRSSGCSTAPGELSFRALGMRFVALIPIQCAYASLIPMGCPHAAYTIQYSEYTMFFRTRSATPHDAGSEHQTFSSHTVILAAVRGLELLAPARVAKYPPSTVLHSNAKRRSAPLG